MLTASGWRIYNADPFWVGEFPEWLTLGEDLPAALHWHTFAMWILMVNGIVAVVLLFLSGRLKYLLNSIQMSRFRSALVYTETHNSKSELNQLNPLQKIAYLVVLCLLIMETLTGLSIWKPVQLQSLFILFGDYEINRRIHFLGMSLLAIFFIGHVALALVSPQLLLGMLGLQRPSGLGGKKHEDCPKSNQS